MENASKALIIAGSVLIALLIIGALLLMFNNLSSYQKVGDQETREAQVVEFNNQFETYIRKDIRGSDMISLMNRIVDYNVRKANNSEENFTEMKIEIYNIDVKNLQHDKDEDAPFVIVKNSYHQDNIETLLTEVQNLEKKYQSKYITALSSNIDRVKESEEKTLEIFPKKFWKNGLNYNQIKQDTIKYYQYSQFKRVYFDCDIDQTQYDKHTGRIIAMKFKCTNKMK